MLCTMSAPPRADFVAGCPECEQEMHADSIDDAAWFYACHREAGHDVEWLWGAESTLTVQILVDQHGGVENLATVVGVLDRLFDPSAVPAELILENCLNAGAEKAVVERQIEQLPPLVRERIDPLD
jgi:hypothetical protein